MVLRSFRREVGCLLVVTASLGACSSSDTGEPSDGTTGSVVVELTQVPSDVLCVRIGMTGSRSVTGLFSVTPGQSSTFSMNGLPLGSLSVTGDAFSQACNGVGGGSVPGWVSDPASVVVTGGSIAAVSLTMRRNGRANVSVDFVDDSLFTSEASDFGPDTLTHDPISGLRWLDVPFSGPYSYDGVRAELGATGVFAGYRIATPEEVLAFWSHGGVDVDNLGAFTQANFQPIVSMMSFVGITGLALGNRDNVHFFDFTAGHVESGVVEPGAFVSVATLAADPYTFFDGRADIGGVPSNNDDDHHGSWLVVAPPPPGLSAVDTAFGAGTGTFDTASGLTWLDVTLSAPYSYDELLGEFGPGGVFQGYRLATQTEVLALWQHAGMDLSVGGFVEANYQPIVNLMVLVGVTGEKLGNRDNVHFFDFTAGHIESGPGGGYVNVATIAADPYFFRDGRADIGTVPSTNDDPNHGAWLVAN